MNYFQVLSFVFGALLILTRVAIHFFPKSWNEFELNKAYPEKQPGWVWVVGLFGLLLVAFTWYMHFTAAVPNSLVITIILSLTLLKSSQVLFNYNSFRQFVERVLTRDRKTLAVINIAALGLGIGLILIGVFLY